MTGDSGPERVLIAASFVNRVGNGLFNAAAALYFTLIVGLPAAQVGAALTIAGLIGLCAGIPGGHLADRRGARMIMMLALVVQAVSMSALVLVESWAALTAIATVDQIAAAAGGAAWGALVARVGGERPAVFRAKLRTFVNLGVVLGTVGAGLAVAADTRGAYIALILGNAASFALCAVLLLLLPPVRRWRHRRDSVAGPPSRTARSWCSPPSTGPWDCSTRWCPCCCRSGSPSTPKRRAGRWPRCSPPTPPSAYSCRPGSAPGSKPRATAAGRSAPRDCSSSSVAR